METDGPSSQGQVILPKSIRDAHQWAPGTGFDVADRPKGMLLRPGKRIPATHMSAVIGCSG